MLIHAHSSMSCLWLLSHPSAEWSSCGRDHVASESSNIYYLTIYRKCLPTAALDHGFRKAAL